MNDDFILNSFILGRVKNNSHDIGDQSVAAKTTQQNCVIIREVECQISNPGLYIFASLCIVIFLENLHHSLKQSHRKLITTIILSSAFSLRLNWAAFLVFV